MKTKLLRRIRKHWTIFYDANADYIWEQVIAFKRANDQFKLKATGSVQSVALAMAEDVLPYFISKKLEQRNRLRRAYNKARTRQNQQRNPTVPV